MASNKVTEAEHKISLDIKFKRDSSGIWNIAIARPKTSFLGLIEAIIGDNKGAIDFKGQILEAPSTEKTVSPKRKLKFHERGGQHSAICENGQTAFAFGNDVFKTWAVTKNALHLNELFEVELKDALVACEAPCQRMGKPDPYYGRTTSLPSPVFCIGVTTTNPASFEDDVDKRPNGWYWTGDTMYVNENSSVNLGKSKLKVGDRVGVLQDLSGKLHFFVNGVDQGEYQMTLPFPLYGCIQFGAQLRTATIKDPDTTYGYLLKINADKKGVVSGAE